MNFGGHGTRRLAQRAGGLLGALAVTAIVMAAAAPAASAHATLLFTSPAAGSAVPVPPKTLTLTFDEPVTLAGPPVTLAGAGGHRIGLGQARLASGRSVITVPVPVRLPAGVYTVSWQVISADGDAVASQYRFAVGPAQASLAAAPAGQPSSPGEWPAAVLRWLLFAGLAVALGGLAGRVLARWCRRSPPAPLPAPWALRGSLLGLAASAGLAALILGGGSLAAGLEHPSVPRLLAGGPGKIAAAQIVSFAAAAVLLRLRRPGWSVLPLLAVVGAEGLRAHPESIVPVGGAVLTWVHLLPAALWTGMLLYVVRTAVAWRADPGAVRGVIRLYARVAAWLFALVVATGVVSALVLVPLSALLTTSYGRVLIVKAALVAAAAALALAGRRWLRRRPAAGAGPALATRAEAGTLVGVLAVAGLLVALPAPASPVQPLPFPPPASGPVTPLGGRAGEVGFYATASAGQLVLSLSAPETSDSGKGSQQYGVSMTLAGPDDPARTLTARGCGPGCFVAPARWATGENLVTMHLTAEGWTGGTVSLDVPWPPAPGGELLRRVAAALRDTPAMTVYERATSNTALGPGRTYHTPISGRMFLSTEPYKTGLASVAVLVPVASGQTQLLLGFPADGIWAELTVAAAGRITAETLAGPDHLITRSFAYPDKGSTR